MIRLIIYLAAVVLIVAGVVWLADNPGEVHITEPWGGNTFSPPFGILLLGVFAVGVAMTALYELYRVIVTAPKKIGRYRKHKRKERGYEELATGLVAAAAGDVHGARTSTRRAEKLLEKAPSTLLLGARSAQLDGNETEARGKYKQMLEHKETEFLGLRGLLGQAIQDGDREEALKIAKKAYLRRPNTPWVLTTLFDLQTEMGEWRDAMATVNDMARQKLIDAETANRHRAILAHLQAEKREEEGRNQEAFENAKKAHKLLPSLAPIAVTAARLAVKLEKHRAARKILEASWKVQPHPALARALGSQSPGQTPTERYRTFERLHQLNPNHLEGELALAEQAVAAEQWPAAREALERAVRLGATASVFRMFADVERATGGDADKIQGWLAKAVDAPSDPTWICRATGETRARWSAFGPDGKFDSLRWGSPPTIVPMLSADAPAELILPDTTRDVPKRNENDELSVAPTRPAPAADNGRADKVDAA
jgi:HemY protein